jgi:predicted transcriptional regulator
VALTVHLPDELVRRVEAAAATRNKTPEQVAVEAIEAQLPVRHRPSFSGVGSSSLDRGDIAQRHREVLAEGFSVKTARDV